MGDRSKFEQMLEYLINDEEAKARELFHDIVVAKSRQIYENLLADDFNDETDESRDDDESTDENMGMGGDMQPPEDPGMESFGGDESDDMLDKLSTGDEEDDDLELMSPDDEGGDMDDLEGDQDITNRVDDLEAELEALRADFEEKLGGDDMDDMGGDDMDDMGGEEEPTKDSMYFEKRTDDDDDEDEDEEKTDEDFIREYVEKVGGGNYNTWGKMGDDGVNTKSPVAGKNDMGGTSQNILRAATYNGKEVGAGSTIEGNGVFKQSKPQVEDFGNINKPGGNAGKTAFKKKEPGHGAEKKGEAEGKTWGSGSGGAVGGGGSINTKSPINGAPKRAK